MKKKLLAMLLITSMAVSVTACGSSDATQQGDEQTEQAQGVETVAPEEKEEHGVVSTRDFNPDDYVTIGDYSSVAIETNSYTFTEDDVINEINKTVDYFLEYTDSYNYVKTDKQTVEQGDIVNMNYCGKLDGEAFDGGTADNAHLEIGSGRFIPGFEDGLVGHSVGESFEIPLTFPENYGTADLAGKDVIFEITLNSIDTREKPELSDELIVKMDIGFDTLDKLKERIRKDFQNNCEDKAANENRDAVWSQVYALCEVKDMPEELVQEVLAGIEQSAKYYADYYKVTVDEFIEQYMNMTKEEYDAEMQTSAQATAKERMAIAAIAKKAGITLSDEDVKKEADEQCSSLGYTTGDDLLTELGKGYFYDYVLGIKVKDYLLTQVHVTANAPASIIEDTQDTDAAVEEATEAAVEETEVDGVEDEQSTDDASAVETEQAETDEDAEKVETSAND